MMDNRMSDFKGDLANSFRRLIDVTGSQSNNSGLEKRLIEEASFDLKLTIPEHLQVFYATAGNLPAVMNSYHHFREPEALEIKDGGLVFCDEHQNALIWAVHLENFPMSDPPVKQAQPQSDSLVWCDECYRLSTFLINMCCWQLINSMPSMAWCPASDGTLKTLKRKLDKVSVTLKYNMASLIESKQGILGTVLFDSEKVYFGAKNDNDLEEFERRTGIELDWL